MTPRVGRALGQGFYAANRSWPGIAVVLAIWLLLGGLASFLVGLTGVPAALGGPAEELVAIAPPAFDEELLADVAPLTVEIPAETTETTDVTVEPAAPPEDLFDELAIGDEDLGPLEPLAEADEELFVDEGGLPDDPAPGLPTDVADWAGRAWPILALIAALGLVLVALVTGGQIGYVAQVLSNQRTQLSTLWRSGGRAFWRVLAATGLSLLAAAAVMVALIGAGFLADAVTADGPEWLAGLLGTLVTAAVFLPVTWLAVRLLLWMVLIVTKSMGPVAGLAASFKAMRGHWWRGFGLVVAMALISYGVSQAFNALGGIGDLLGGAGGAAVGAIVSVAGTTASLYLGFAFTGALLQFASDLEAVVPSG